MHQVKSESGYVKLDLKFQFQYLLAAVWRQVEDKDGEEGDAHAGNDEVDSIKEGLPPHRHIEGDVQVGLITARVVFDVAYRRHLQDVPLDRHVELGEVHANLHLGPAIFLVNVTQVHLVAVVGPWAELHDAGLLVEGEVLHVHLARRVIDGRRLPLDFSSSHQCGFGG